MFACFPSPLEGKNGLWLFLGFLWSFICYTMIFKKFDPLNFFGVNQNAFYAFDFIAAFISLPRRMDKKEMPFIWLRRPHFWPSKKPTLTIQVENYKSRKLGKNITPFTWVRTFPS